MAADLVRVSLRLPFHHGLAVGIENTDGRAALADIQTHAVCGFVPERRAGRSGAGCCALPAILAHCAARIAMSRPAPVVGLANRPDPEPASADDGDAGRCAKSSKPFSICYGQDVPGGFCSTVFRHGARYTSGSAPCATMRYSKASIIISFGSIASCQGENQHHPRQSRSEEPTSELQSLMRISYAVFCLKKKKQ